MILVFVPIFAMLWIGMVGAGGGRLVEAICARCKYPAAGLTLGLCPECGSDLSGQGTRQPGDCRYVWRPPLIVTILSTIIMVSSLSGPAGLYILYHGPQTWRDHLRVTVAPSGADQPGWSASLEASGSDVRRVAAWDYEVWHLGVPRDAVRLIVRTTDGQVGSIRVVDHWRRVRYRNAEGQNVTSVDGVAPSDIADWARVFKDARARDSITGAAPTLISLLGAGSSGTDAVPCPKGFSTSNGMHSRYSYPWLPLSLLFLGAWTAFVSLTVRYIRRSNPRPIVVWT